MPYIDDTGTKAHEALLKFQNMINDDAWNAEMTSLGIQRSLVRRKPNPLDENHTFIQFVIQEEDGKPPITIRPTRFQIKKLKQMLDKYINEEMTEGSGKFGG